jgi:hypothetical protein
MVPNKPEAYYRLNAVKCVEFSQDPIVDIKNKTALLVMANAWLELAHRAEQQRASSVGVLTDL